MGLDITIRWVRKNAQKTVPITRWDGTITYTYDSKDVQFFDEDWMQGRYEFSVIREWVGNDRYGQYIPLVGEDYAQLVKMVEAEIRARIEEEKKNRQEHPDWYELDEVIDFPWFLINSIRTGGLEKLYGIILKAPLFEEAGWIMEIECNW